MLIFLGEQDWFFLSDEQIVIGEVEEDIFEVKKDLLNVFCLGLYELVVSEWVGVFYLFVFMLCILVYELLKIVGLFEESIYLGRVFYVVEYIYLLWELYFE